MASHDIPIGSSQVSLASLNERSREIFRQIVESYLATGEPVGSRNLSRILPICAVAGLGAQRDVGPRAARPHLRAAHLGRPAADRTRPALLRRRADGDRRSDRKRPPLDRGAGGRLRRRQIGGDAAHRSLADAVGPDALGRRRAHHQDQSAAQAHRIRAAGAGARAGRAGGRRRPGGKPRAQRAAGPADLGAGRGRQFPQRAYPRQDARPTCAPRSRPRSSRARPSSIN